LDDRRAIVERRDFLEYRFQQFRGDGGANGDAPFEQFVIES
jgi:hypothetical protein